MGPSIHEGMDQHKFQDKKDQAIEEKEVLLDHYYHKFKSSTSANNWNKLKRAMFDYQVVRQANDIRDLSQQQLDADFKLV